MSPQRVSTAFSCLKVSRRKSRRFRRRFDRVFAVVDRMSGRRDKLNRKLEEAVRAEVVGEIERLVKQEGADVNCRDSDVCYCLIGQVVECGKISFIFFHRGGLYSTAQHSSIAMMW